MGIGRQHSRQTQQVDHVLIRQLRKIPLVLAHRHEIRLCLKINDLIAGELESSEGVPRGNGDRYDDKGGALLAHGMQRGPYGGAGCDAVIRRDHHSSA